MQLNHVFALPMAECFGPSEDSGFQEYWFPDIRELQEGIDFFEPSQALAAANRLTARMILQDCDNTGEYGGSVVALFFDGQPMALVGAGGKRTEVAYHLVVNATLYAEAESHVRSFVPQPQSQVHVVNATADYSLHYLFGQHFHDMAERAIGLVRETFGDAAHKMVGYDALPAMYDVVGPISMHWRKDGNFYLLLTPREVGPAWIYRSGAWLQQVGPSSDEETMARLRGWPKQKSAWTYRASAEGPIAGETDVGRL